MAALQKGVQTHEESAVLEAPGVGRTLLGSLRLVVEVGALEGHTIFQAQLQVFNCLLRLFDVLKQGLPTDEILRLNDDCVAQLAHEDDESGW